MRGQWAACAAMELGWSFGGSGFIEADAMVRGHFSIFCSDAYVVNFVSNLVVVVTSLRKFSNIRILVSGSNMRVSRCRRMGGCQQKRVVDVICTGGGGDPGGWCVRI